MLQLRHPANYLNVSKARSTFWVVRSDLSVTTHSAKSTLAAKVTDTPPGKLQQQQQQQPEPEMIASSSTGAERSQTTSTRETPLKAAQLSSISRPLFNDMGDNDNESILSDDSFVRELKAAMKPPVWGDRHESSTVDSASD